MSESKEADYTAANFPPLKNDNLLRAARLQPTPHVPIWLHRQAGRYLPEFREARKKNDFFTICQSPPLACEVTLQPIDRFELDASIIFSDIMVIPQALGLEVLMVPGKGPTLPDPLVSPKDLERLNETVDVKKSLGYVFDAITLTRHKLKGKVPLIGFSGAPWTLMAYMVHGGGAKSYNFARAWLYKHPKESHVLLQKTTEVIIEYMVGQVAAGAQMLEVFDSWAGDLSPDLFSRFGLPYLKKIATGVKQALKARGMEVVPMTVFARGAHWALEELADTDYDVISLDWTMDPEEARRRVQGKVALQGNLDPAVLFAPKEVIEAEAGKLVKAFGTTGYIFNLGHGMLPSHPPEAVETLVNAVHAASIALNKK